VARKLCSVALAGSIISASSLMLAASAEAASQVTATSVALNSGANCEDASLDLGMVSGSVDREYGLATDSGGAVLAEFESESDTLDNLNGVFARYHIDLEPDRPDGTIIGSYAYVGTTAPRTETTAEWFVLYVCDARGANEVLHTCYGDYGTCPTSADQVLAAAVSTTTPMPGEMLTVAVAGCFVPAARTASVSLLRDGSLLGSTPPITPNTDGTLTANLAVPVNISPSTRLELSVVCGHASAGLHRVLSLTVAGEGTPASATLQPVGIGPNGPAPPAGGSTRPLFTG
jgi:hypothetical protein